MSDKLMYQMYQQRIDQICKDIVREDITKGVFCFLCGSILLLGLALIVKLG
jgi:hypothetical protein